MVEFREPPSPFAPFKIFLDLARWAIFIILFLFSVGVILYLLTAGGRAQETGVLQYAYTQADVALSKTPVVDTLYTGVKTLIKFREDPSTALRTYNFKGEVDESQENRELGLTFSNVKSQRERYVEGERDPLTNELEPIKVSAKVRAMSFKDDSKIVFSCKDTTSDIFGTTEPTEVILKKNIPSSFDVKCFIDMENIKLGEQQIRGEKIVLKANYDFRTKSYISAWAMSSEKLDFLQNREDPINPFKFEGIDDPQLNEESGEAKTIFSRGPMEVLIGLESQPFTEKGTFGTPYYDLRLVIEGSSLGPIYQGRLSKINNVFLYLPKDPINYELSQEDLERNFDVVEEVEDEDLVFTKYKLKQEKINLLSEQCSRYNYNDLECSSLWERGFELVSTKFRITHLSKEDLEQHFIRADVDYEFEAQTSKAVTIVKSLKVVV